MQTHVYTGLHIQSLATHVHFMCNLCASTVCVQVNEKSYGLKIGNIGMAISPGWREAHNVYKACVGTTEVF